MKKNFSLFALTGALLVGGFLGFQLNDSILAQSSPVAQIQQDQSKQDQVQKNAIAQNRTQSDSSEANERNQTEQSDKSNKEVVAQSRSKTSSKYNNRRAKTESEANTVDVVKKRQAGLVYLSIKEVSRMRLPLSRSPERSGAGSGFFINKKGDVITNSHVVEGNKTITARIPGDDKEYEAKVIATAPDYDLALIRLEGIDKDKIQPMPLGNSENLDVGLKAIAMGAPFGLEFSVSEGIISSLERTVEIGTREDRAAVEQKVIQTDAAINPGNSGGPLLNSAGEVIGVNTQIATAGVGQSSGVGFAIPINTVKRLLPQLKAGKGGEIKTPSLGISMLDLKAFSPRLRREFDFPDKGLLIHQVFTGSPADKAGLRAGKKVEEVAFRGQVIELAYDGDILVKFDGKAIDDPEDIRKFLLEKKIGDKVEVEILRDGEKKTVEIKLEFVDFSKRPRN